MCAVYIQCALKGCRDDDDVDDDEATGIKWRYDIPFDKEESPKATTIHSICARKKRK